MGGKILEYEARTILNEGWREGWREGWKEGWIKGWREGLAKGQILVFTNLIKRGFSVEDAMSIAEITKEQAEKAIADMKKQG